MTETMSFFAVFLMERWALGMREPASLVTIPERVLAADCEKTRNGTRTLSKKAIEAGKRTRFPLARLSCDGRVPRLSLCFKLWRPPGRFAVTPNMTIPLNPRKLVLHCIPISHQPKVFRALAWTIYGTTS